MKKYRTFDEAFHAVLEMTPEELQRQPIDETLADVFATFDMMDKVVIASTEDGEHINYLQQACRHELFKMEDDLFNPGEDVELLP